MSTKRIRFGSAPGAPIAGQGGGGFRHRPSRRRMCDRSDAKLAPKLLYVDLEQA